MNEDEQLAKSKQACATMDAITAAIKIGLPVPERYIVKGTPVLGKHAIKILREEALTHIQQLEILCSHVFAERHVWRGIIQFNLGVVKEHLLLDEDPKPTEYEAQY